MLTLCNWPASGIVYGAARRFAVVVICESTVVVPTVVPAGGGDAMDTTQFVALVLQRLEPALFVALTRY